MRIVCAPAPSALARAGDHDLDIVLYGPARNSGQASVGALIPGRSSPPEARALGASVGSAVDRLSCRRDRRERLPGR